MANEAVPYAEGPIDEAGAIVRYFTVADGTAIAKGTFMVSGGDRTAVAHANANQRPLGIAVSSKTASDGKTTIGLQRSGAIKYVAGATVVTGDILVLDTTANRLVALTAPLVGTLYIEMWRIVGRALEDATVGQTKKCALTLE